MTTSSTSTGPRLSLGTMVQRHRGVIGCVAALGATASAATWLVVVPEKAADVALLQSWLLQYAHSVCWGLLAVAAGAWAVRAPQPAVRRAAGGALAAYVAFLAALAL